MRRLRDCIEPQLDIAEESYPKVLELILGYEEFVDSNGDENNEEYKNIEKQIHEIVKKDMSLYSFWETWEGEGPEVTAFRISLPEPFYIEDLTPEEVMEIIRRLKSQDFASVKSPFGKMFSPYLGNYYHKLLKINLKKYRFSYFLVQKGGIELTAEEILKCIL